MSADGVGGGRGIGTRAPQAHMLKPMFALVVLVAGGLSGVLAMSALIASGVVPVQGAQPSTEPPGELAIVACPGSGPALALVDPGQRMLVTGRSADGAWLRVFVPGPAANDGWAPAFSLNLLADGAALPTGDCEAYTQTATPVATATESAMPTPSPTPTPQPATAPPTPLPTPTPRPATAAPTPSPTPTPTSRPTRTPETPTPSPTPTLGPRLGQVLADAR